MGPCEGEVGRIPALSTFPLVPLKLGLVKLPLGLSGLADLAAPDPWAVAFKTDWSASFTLGQLGDRCGCDTRASPIALGCCVPPQDSNK